ncbi:MAG: DEAD/DEAH box helicase [Pirellulales bacterium]|nr:DEAD/DEAH box helicase [Pirellulales bacterium]
MKRSRPRQPRRSRAMIAPLPRKQSGLPMPRGAQAGDGIAVVDGASLLSPPALAVGSAVLAAGKVGTRGARLEVVAPEAFSAPLPTYRVRVTGRLLPEGQDALRGRQRTGPPPAPRLRPTPPLPSHATLSRWTRIKPPRDVVRLEDRLAYLLQPPLEHLLAAEALAFPYRPFPYQLDGIAYLYPRHEAVLADEMGLGKTMQTVVALRLLACQRQVRRALLVCPKPLVTNWRREFATWAPELPVTIVEGSQAQRNWLWTNAAEGVLLANYEVVVRDREQASGAAAPFDLAIVDEAQRIKNRASATSEAVCAIPRLRSWALTGTPIENTADDLVGIFDFVSPGRLRPQMKTSAIRRAVADHVLRRTKEQVLTQLPPKLFRDAELTLSPEQADSYQRAEEEGVVRLNHLGVELTIQHVFELVLRLKQICNFDPATGASAKLDRLEADLEECAASGRKAIVFSQWVDTIERLRGRIARFGPLEYHGRVPSGRRDAVIEQFRNDPQASVLLMSYGAGSVGLNLQFASYVFLFDRWWNPAVEDQAINRAHRIGAAGPVTISRFLTAGTIEERIDRVLAEKRELFREVFDGQADAASMGLSRDEIFGLFKLTFPEAA